MDDDVGRHYGVFGMIGAIAGDIIGSVHEGAGTKTLRTGALERLDPRLRSVAERFVERYGGGSD